jgi:hypothetical protein
MIELHDTKGLRYIAQLVHHPGEELHVFDLMNELRTEPDPVLGASPRAVLGSAGPILDSRARAEYHRRMDELRTEVEEATGWADIGRARRAEEELAFLTQQLASAYGLGGRARNGADISERARKAVTNRIRETIGRIRKDHPSLAGHLSKAVRTGLFCSYVSSDPLQWQLDPP